MTVPATVLVAPIGIPAVDLPAVPPELSLLPELQCICGRGADRSWCGAGQLADVRRLLRCGPWHPGGLDPVPPRQPRTGASLQHRPCRGVAQCSTSSITPCRGSCGLAQGLRLHLRSTGPSAGGRWRSRLPRVHPASDPVQAVRRAGQVHAQDGRVPARDQEASGQVQERQAEARGGDAEAPVRARREPARRLSADPAPDPCLHRPEPRAAVVHRPGLPRPDIKIPNYWLPTEDVQSFLQARLFGAPLSCTSRWPTTS